GSPTAGCRGSSRLCYWRARPGEQRGGGERASRSTSAGDRFASALVEERQPAILDGHAPDHALRALGDVEEVVLEGHLCDARAGAFGQLDAADGEALRIEHADFAALEDRRVEIARHVERHAVGPDAALDLDGHVRDV